MDTTTSGGAGTSGGTGGAAGMGGEAPEAGPTGNPMGIKVEGANRITIQLEGTAGGGAFEQSCNPGEVIVGFNGTMDAPTDMDAKAWLKSAEAICGTLSLTGTGPYQVTVMESGRAGPVGGVSSVELNPAKCPPNQVVVGYGGRSGNYIDALDFQCAALLINGGPGSYTLSIDTPSTSTPIGGTGGGAFGPYNCDTGQVAVGMAGQSGAWIDSFGLLCGTVSLSF